MATESKANFECSLVSGTQLQTIEFKAKIPNDSATSVLQSLKYAAFATLTQCPHNSKNSHSS